MIKKFKKKNVNLNYLLFKMTILIFLQRIINLFKFKSGWLEENNNYYTYIRVSNNKKLNLKVKVDGNIIDKSDTIYPLM